MVTFAVDDVAPAPEALPTRSLADTLTGALAVGGDPALPVRTAMPGAGRGSRRSAR
jgi:hypothetical protein